MKFVNREGGIEVLALLAGGHPLRIVPLITVEVPYH